MSYKRRQAQIAQEHEFYESPSGNMEAWSSDQDLDYGAAFPGPRETRYLDSQNHQYFGSDYAIDSVDGRVGVQPQWDVDGIVGQTKFVGSSGVTDPQTVDAHNFLGEMAVIRRMPDTNYGPVKTNDHNSLLSLLYAMQESAHYFPNEVSQADIIKAV